MPIKDAKELFIWMLSDLRQGAERSTKLFQELTQIAQDPDIKEALNARVFISSKIMNTLDECFKIIGQKPVNTKGRLHEVFAEDFRLVFQPPGGKPMTFKPTVLAADPARELRWLGRVLMPRLFDGEHGFRLEPTVGGCRLHHGETFREHWQLGHTSSLYDEEIHVPGWIDAPPGTLAPEEEASIKSAKREYVWHLDLATTLFDLMGIWDDPAFAPFRARMMGHPVTRRERTLEPMPLTNCTWVWECSFRNWGMMQGPMKLEAREWDNEYHCFNVLEDPEEQNNLGEQACWPLPDLARAVYHVMPNVTPPGRPITDWGKK
jgi:hypothetical protein